MITFAEFLQCLRFRRVACFASAWQQDPLSKTSPFKQEMQSHPSVAVAPADPSPPPFHPSPV